MRTLLRSTGIGIALLLASQVLHAQGGYYNHIRICNSGNTRLLVARVTSAGGSGGWFAGNDWFSEGWYAVDPDDCELLQRDHDSNGWGYYYFGFRITGRNGTGTIKYSVETGFLKQKVWDNTDKSFCVDNKEPFSIKAQRSSSFEDLDNCPPGWILMPFSLGVDIAYSGNHEFPLTLSPDSSSLVQLVTSPDPPDQAIQLRTPPPTRKPGQPVISNRSEISAALRRERPRELRSVGGQVMVLFLVSETGQVVESRLGQTSGHEELDAAALRVARIVRFRPALDSDEWVQAWIRLPMLFPVR